MSKGSKPRLSDLDLAPGMSVQKKNPALFRTHCSFAMATAEDQQKLTKLVAAVDTGNLDACYELGFRFVTRSVQNCSTNSNLNLLIS